MRHLTFLLTLAVHAAAAQTADMAADITLREPPTSCTLILHADANFGSIRQHTTGTAINPVRPAGTGTFSFAGSYANTFTVQVTFPSALESSSATLPYRGAWAQSQTPHNGFLPIASAAYQRSGLSLVPFTHYFRVGGTVSNPSGNTPPGIYRARMTIAGSCH